MLLVDLLACTRPEGDTHGPPPPPSPISYTIEPTAVDFGEPAIDARSDQVVLLTNTGESDLLLVQGTGPAGVDIDFQGVYWLAPEAETAIALAWTPVDPLGLQGEVQLELANDAESTVVGLPVSGVGKGAAITLTTEEVPFGFVSVGCDREFAVTITNTGNEDLQIDDIALIGHPAFTILPIAMPLVLHPFHSQDIDIEFIPRDLDPATALVRIDSDFGERVVRLSGTGMADGESTLSFVATDERRKMTALWQVNSAIIDGPYSYGPHAARLEDSLETYFETLQDSGAEYRMAFIWRYDGVLEGDFIDNRLSPEEAKDVALEQLSGSNWEDNDSSFTTLLAAIDENYDWLFEDAAWEQSKLNLIAVNRDSEQSGGVYTTYVREAQDYKADAEDVVFHAIAGTPPYGCGEGTVGFQGFVSAVEATGGSFYPLCDADWNENMAALALATEASTSLFPLNGTVVVGSLEVTVDGVPTLNGWYYDESLNAVVFYPEDYPSMGSTVEIHYLHPTGCG